MRTRTRVAAFFSVAALAATACGGGTSLDVQSDPQGAVTAAFNGMGDWAGVSFTFRLDSDVESLVAMGEGDMSPDLARTILDSRLTVKGHAGDDAADATDDEFEMVVKVGDLDGLAMRMVDGALYMRADVRALLEKFDPSGGAATGMDQFLAQAPSMGMDFLPAAADGAWLKLEGFEEAAQMMAGMTGQPQPDPAEAQAMAEAFMTAFQTFLDEDVSTAYVGTDDAGEHVRLSTTGDAALDLLEELVGMAGPMMGNTGGVDPSFAIDELRREAGPDAERLTIPLDVWIDGDTVSQVGFDVIAFADLNVDVWPDAADKPEGLERFTVLLELDEFGGGVDAPSDPVVVNLMQMFGMLMSGLGGQPAAA